MKRMFTRQALAGAILAAIGSGAYAAQGGAQSQLPEFDKLDANSSNYIETSEAQQALSPDQFRNADSDRDMRLSENEYDSFKQQNQGMAQAGQQGQQGQGMQAQADQQGQQGQQGQGMQAQAGQQGAGGGADIRVQERSAEVQVEQEPPQVTVEQQSPDIAVTQPPPEVTVQQSKPDVQVQQAKPQVEIQQQGQPQVAIREAGEPEVTYREGDTPSQQQPEIARSESDVEPLDQQDMLASGQPQGIEAMTIGDLSGMSVSGVNGEDIGEVEQLARSTQDDQVYAIVSGGGFLGIGEDRAAVPLDQLSLQQDKLVWQTASGEEALERRSFNEQEYVNLEQQEETTIAELTGQQPTATSGTTQLSFQNLDQNNDGVVSQDEAQQAPILEQNWQQADADSNQQLDQSEFSAFEEQFLEPSRSDSQMHSPQGGIQGGGSSGVQGGTSGGMSGSVEGGSGERY